MDEFAGKLWQLLGRQDIRLHRDVPLSELRARSKGYVYPFIPPDCVLEADEPVDYATLNQARQLIERHQTLASENDSLRSQNAILNGEVSEILNLEESFLIDEIYLGNLFSFLGASTHVCILRGGHPLVCRGLAEQTRKYCISRLSHQPEFSVQVREGELFALNVDDYQAIFEAEEPISDFAKRIIRLKLSWLGSKHREKLFIQRLRYLEERFQTVVRAESGTGSRQGGLDSSTMLNEQYRRLDDELRALMNQAIKDSLTNVYNRSKITQLLSSAIIEAEQHNTTFTVVMFDIDYFKAINDTYGHLVGDRVLIGIAERTRNALRATDILARWGGEEFVVLLPATDEPHGVTVATKLRNCVADESFEADIAITCSYGIAQYNGEDDPEAILERADSALYRAKDEGRNCVMASHSPVGPR